MELVLKIHQFEIVVLVQLLIDLELQRLLENCIHLTMWLYLNGHWKKLDLK